MEALHKKYKDQGLVVIGITWQRDRAMLKEFAKGRISYTVLLDGNEQCRQYRVPGYPRTHYIDRKGKIRYGDLGFETGWEKDMEEKVKDLLLRRTGRGG